MGFGGIGIWQLLIVLAIILLIFGTKRLRNLGGDLGGAIKGFKKAMSEEEKKVCFFSDINVVFGLFGKKKCKIEFFFKKVLTSKINYDIM